MLFTGEMIDAATALEWGLVNRVVPADRLDDEVEASSPNGSPARARTCSRSASVRSTRRTNSPRRAAYDIACAGDGRQRAGRRRARGHARVPREAGAAVAEPIVEHRASAPLRRVRAAAASCVRAAVDRRVRLEHRHVDGDARARHLRDQDDARGGVDRNGRGGRVRPDRASSARSGARSPTGSRASGCS